MAETIIQTQLPDLAFANSKIPLIISSPNTGEPDFRFRANFRPLSGDNVLRRNFTQRPDANGIGYFELGSFGTGVQGVIGTSLEYDTNALGSTNMNMSQSIGQFQLVVGSEYSTGAEAILTGYNGQGQVGAPGLLSKTITVALGPYTTQGNTALSEVIPTVLTNSNVTQTISVVANYFHYIPIKVEPSTPLQMVFTAGGTISTRTLSNITSYAIVSSQGTGLPQLDPGFRSAARAAGSYTVSIDGKTWTYKLDASTKVHDTYGITFINRYGYWDTIECNAKPSKTTLVGKTTVTNGKEVINASGGLSNTYTNGAVNVFRPNSIVSSISRQTNAIARTTPLQSEVGDWLSDIVASPVLFRQAGTDHIPITITTNTFEIQDQYDPAYELEFSLVDLI